jgi:hypothetical protein
VEFAIGRAICLELISDDAKFALLFLADPVPVFERMLTAASKAVIVVDPIRNLFNSGSPLVTRIAVKLSGPGGDRAQRFNKQSLDRLV